MKRTMKWVLAIMMILAVVFAIGMAGAEGGRRLRTQMPAVPHFTPRRSGAQISVQGMSQNDKEEYEGVTCQPYTFTVNNGTDGNVVAYEHIVAIYDDITPNALRDTMWASERTGENSFSYTFYTPGEYTIYVFRYDSMDSTTSVGWTYEGLPYNFMFFNVTIKAGTGTNPLTAAVNSAAAVCNKGDDFLTAVAINDYLADLVTYDYSYTYYSPEAALVGDVSNHYGVCNSYSRAYKMIADACGLECKRVTGCAGDDGGDPGNNGHAWNAVKINGEWYQVDATWNDGSKYGSRHVYMGLNDSLMKTEHYGQYNSSTGAYENDFHYPDNDPVQCGSLEENYFIETGKWTDLLSGSVMQVSGNTMYLKDGNDASVMERLQEQINAGNTVEVDMGDIAWLEKYEGEDQAYDSSADTMTITGTLAAYGLSQEILPRTTGEATTLVKGSFSYNKNNKTLGGTITENSNEVWIWLDKTDVTTEEPVSFVVTAPGASQVSVYCIDENEHEWYAMDEGTVFNGNHGFLNSGTYTVTARAEYMENPGNGAKECEHGWYLEVSAETPVTVTAEYTEAIAITDNMISLADGLIEGAPVNIDILWPENAGYVFVSTSCDEYEGMYKEQVYSISDCDENGKIHFQLTAEEMSEIRAGAKIWLTVQAGAKGYEGAKWSRGIPVDPATSSPSAVLLINGNYYPPEETHTIPVNSFFDVTIIPAEGENRAIRSVILFDGYDYYDEYSLNNGDPYQYCTNFWNGGSFILFAKVTFDPMPEAGEEDNRTWVYTNVVHVNSEVYGQLGENAVLTVLNENVTATRGERLQISFGADTNAAWGYGISIYQLGLERCLYYEHLYNETNQESPIIAWLPTAGLEPGEYYVDVSYNPAPGYTDKDLEQTFTVTENPNAPEMTDPWFVVESENGYVGQPFWFQIYIPNTDDIVRVNDDETGHAIYYRNNSAYNTLYDTITFDKAGDYTFALGSGPQTITGPTIHIFSNGNVPEPELTVSKMLFTAAEGLTYSITAGEGAAAIEEAANESITYKLSLYYAGLSSLKNEIAVFTLNENQTFNGTLPAEVIAGMNPGTMYELRLDATLPKYVRSMASQRIMLIDAATSDEDHPVTLLVEDALNLKTYMAADFIISAPGAARISLYNGSGWQNYEMDSASGSCFFYNSGEYTMFAKAFWADPENPEEGVWYLSNVVECHVTPTPTLQPIATFEGFSGNEPISVQQGTPLAVIIPELELATTYYASVYQNNETGYYTNVLSISIPAEFMQDIPDPENPEQTIRGYRFILPTEALTPGDYRFSIGAGGTGCFGGSTEYSFTITNGDVQTGSVTITCDKTTALTGEIYTVTASAPGATQVSIMEGNYVQKTGKTIAIWTNDEDWEGARTYHAVAVFPGGETAESDIIEIQISAPYGRINPENLSISIPTLLTAESTITISTGEASGASEYRVAIIEYDWHEIIYDQTSDSPINVNISGSQLRTDSVYRIYIDIRGATGYTPYIIDYSHILVRSDMTGTPGFTISTDSGSTVSELSIYNYEEMRLYINVPESVDYIQILSPKGSWHGFAIPADQTALNIGSNTAIAGGTFPMIARGWKEGDTEYQYSNIIWVTYKPCPHEHTEIRSNITDWENVTYDENDGNNYVHTVTGTGITYEYCTDCFNTVPGTETEGQVSETRSHSYNEAHRCAECGHVCTHDYDLYGNCKACSYVCPHTAIEDLTEDTEGTYYIYYNSTCHVIYTVKTDTYHCCETCGYKEITETNYSGESGRAPHEYTDHGYCVCGAYCPHEGIEDTNEIVSEAVNQGIVCVDSGYHVQGTYHDVWKKCPVCGEYIFQRRILIEATGEQTVHNFNSNGWCSDCGYQCPHETFNDNHVCTVCGFVCNHNNGTERRYEWGEGTQIESDNNFYHIINGTQIGTDYCVICGAIMATYTDTLEGRYTHSYYDQEEGENEAVCEVCGHVNNCEHSDVAHTMTYSGHYDELVYTDTDDSNAYHTVTGTATLYDFCNGCGMRTNVRVVEGYQNTEGHSYDENGHCNLCGHDNTCTHENARDNYGIYSREGASFTKIQGDDDYHTVTGMGYGGIYCPDCWHYIGNGYQSDIEVSIQERHQYNTDGVCENCGHVCAHSHMDETGFCSSCGYQCPHTSILEGQTETTEGAFYIFYDNDIHKIYTQKTDIYRICETCGYKQITNTEYGGESSSAPHAYTDHGYCVCGAYCQHEGIEDTNELTDEEVHEGIVFVDSSHHVTGTFHFIYKICPVCGERVNQGKQLIVETGEQTAHDFDNYGWCEDCGYQCPHETFDANHKCTVCGFVCGHCYGTTYRYEWGEGTQIVSADDYYHHITGTRTEIQSCDRCGEILSSQTETIDGHYTHSYHDQAVGETAAVCEECGHVNGCEHTDTYATYSFDGHYDELTYSDTDSNATHTVTGTATLYNYCSNCGMRVNVRTQEGYQVTEGHGYNENGKCSQCGHINTCTHENARDDYGFYNREGATYTEIQGDNEYHTITAMGYGGIYCPDCCMWLGEGYQSNIEVSLPDGHQYQNGVCDNCGHICMHEFDGSGCCRFCDISCTHPNAETVIDDTRTEYERISITEHLVRIIQTSHIRCPICEYTSEPETVILSERTEAHTDSDNDDTCDICGYGISTYIIPTISEDNRTLTIDGQGPIRNYTSGDETPWAEYRDTVTRIIIGPNVTGIGDYAFAGFENSDLRIEFLQESKPTISTTAFSGTTATGRYYSGGSAWQDDTITLIRLPYYDKDDSIRDIYFAGDRWYIMPRTTDGYQKYTVTGGQALEYTHRGRDIHFEAIPTEVDDIAVLQGWEGVGGMYFHLECEGSITIDLPADSTMNWIDMYAAGTTVTVNDPRENGAEGRTIVEKGTLIYKGNVGELLLHNSYDEEGHVTIDGDIGVLNYYDTNSTCGYHGDLTVTGTIASGTIYKQRSMTIPGIGNVTFDDMADAIISDEIQQETAIVTNSQLTLTEANAAKVTTLPVPDISDFDIQYQFLDDRVSFSMTPMNTGVESAYSANISDIYAINPDFEESDVIYGENTRIYIGMITDTTKVLTFDGAQDGQGNKTGLKEVSMEPNCKVVINCPVEKVYVNHYLWSPGDIVLTINGRVEEYTMNIDGGAGTSVTLGENGYIQDGTWNRTIAGSRYFGPESGAGELFANGTLSIMSRKSGDTMQARLPSDITVSQEAGKQATIDIAQANVSELTTKELNAMNDFLDDQKIGSAVTVFDVSVTEVVNDGNNNLSAGEPVTVLNNAVSMTVSNEADGSAYILRLHENADGTVSPEQLNNATTDTELTFASNLFSKYVLVSVNVLHPDDLTTLYLPTYLTEIEAEAFAGVGAQAIVIPESVTTIGENAFAYCPNLVLVISPIPIPDEAFTGCAHQVEVRTPNAGGASPR